MRTNNQPPATLRISRENAVFQVLEALKTNREKRSETGRIFVEGVSSLDALIATERRVIDLIREDGRRVSDWAREIENRAQPERIILLTPELMRKLSDRENPSELIAIAQRPIQTTVPAAATGKDLRVLADRPSSPGNLGTLIRSCDAFGIKELFLLGHAADPFDPRCIRASIGTVFHLPIRHFPSNESAGRWISDRKTAFPGFQVVVTSAKGAISLDEAEFGPDILIVIGNETHGASRFLKDLADLNIRIPLCGHASSLNMASAASIVLYEASLSRKTSRG